MSGDRITTSRGDDAPPPPYTETDVYSATSVSGAASHMSSTTSGDPIYTPPASPIAGSYFETRPLPPSTNRSSDASMVHHIAIGPDTLPDDVPYNSGLAVRDVTEQDWATFRNYLLPDHVARGNEALVDRKLRHEGRSEDGRSTTSSKTYAEAQLGSIRSATETGAPDRMDEAQLRSHAVSTVQEWNTAFFMPRGVTIHLDLIQSPFRAGTGQSGMPGAWDSTFEDQAGQMQHQARQQQEHQRQIQQQQRQQQDQQRQQQDQQRQQQEQQRQQQEQARAGWRRHLDRVKVTDNMLRIGDSFVADVNGVKIGSMVMDGRGVRMDGSQPQPPPGMGGMFPRGPEQHHSPRGFGRGSPFGMWAGPSSPHAHQSCSGQRGRSFGEEQTGATKQRSHSVSSVSSSSSSSSTDSDGSLDDLPDYDDIKDSQLPLYADRLDAWVKTPDTIRTRQDLANLRAELKTVQRAGLEPGVDQKALRQQVKTLRSQWKTVRKEQRRVLRERKKERKMKRRGERRERRQRRKEVKRSQRELKREHRGERREQRGERREHRGGRREIHGGERNHWPNHCGPPGIPGMPGMPGIPGMSASPAPSAPRAPYGRSGSWSGMFGNRGIFGPQGSFDPHFSTPNHHGPSHPFHPDACTPGTVPADIYGPCDRSFPVGPPGAWPQDVKVMPEEDLGPGEQEAGVMDGPSRQDKMKELEKELESKITSLDSLDQGKERRETEKEVEALVEKLDWLRLEADEAYARELENGA